MTRRDLLSVGSGAALSASSAHAASIPIIDTHIHLFDTTRPQGVPWPEKTDRVRYQPALPGRLRKIAAPLGVKGAIKVEASPWLEDNQWVLDVIRNEPFILGAIGNLEPGAPDFRKQLDRFRRDPLFLGIRYGNLWDRDLRAQLAKPDFVAGLKALAAANLTLDSANPNQSLVEDLVRLTDKVPELRLVIDHLPQMRVSTDPPARAAHLSDLRKLAQRPRVWVKISEVLRRVDGRVPLDLDVYRPRLDELVGIFGEDRVLYGSDWPNSDGWAPYPQVLKIVREYFMAKGPAVAEKYFWKNSVAAYRWKPRDPSQPQA